MIDPAGSRSGRTVTLQTAARRSGSACWLAGRLFEIMGAWVGEVDEPPARVLLDAHSAQHAWHARLWAERLPVLADLERADLIRPPGRRCRRAFEVLATTDGAVARVAGLYRVVIPRLIVQYRSYQAQSSPATDGPVRRVLRLVQADLAEQWIEGEEILQGLLSSAGDVASATRAVAALDLAFVAS